MVRSGRSALSGATGYHELSELRSEGRSYGAEAKKASTSSDAAEKKNYFPAVPFGYSTVMSSTNSLPASPLSR